MEEHVLETNAGKQAVLSCHRYLINFSVKNGQHLNMDFNFDHQMSLSKSECWYSNNCLHFYSTLFHYGYSFSHNML
jgi:hypothetical protein